MAIAQNIQKIRTATLGKEVRDGIADSIEECYSDAIKNGNANMEVSIARGSYNSLGERQDAVEESAKNALEQLTQKATKAELATQKARIDGITALTQGSTTGDAELQDIRVKVDGTTATTAGTAVREQIAANNAKIDNVQTVADNASQDTQYLKKATKKSINIYTAENEFGSLDPTTGADKPNGTVVYIRTKEMILDTLNTEIQIQFIADNCTPFPIYSSYVFFYNANKGFVKYNTLSVSNKAVEGINVSYSIITIPANACYFKVLYSIKDSYKTISIAEFNNYHIQILYSTEVISKYYAPGAIVKSSNIEEWNEVKDLDTRVTSIEKAIGKKSSDNPLEVIKETAGFTRVFNKIACIGDSVTSGCCVKIGDVGKNANFPVYSFPTQLAKITGSTVYNWGAGGTTMVNDETYHKGWMQQESVTKYAFGNSDTEAIVCDAYIIALGGNDALRHLTSVGTDADIDSTNYDNNANSFIGMYDKLIRKLRQVSPRSKIFICTYPLPMKNSEYIKAYQKAIRDIASSNRYEDLWLIDLGTYASKYFVADVDYIGKDVHQTAVGYLKKAQCICTYIDYIIRNNYSDFNNVQFIDSANAENS